ncbi:MAG: TonB-dependent receptor [Saprospiraceae bacterium]|nr:TonB-dependent receptor [Saprospiraceae bacterium]MDW8485202.1 outer membrane beta-barrel protein [Saprospiraceae bacterium]
MKKQVLLSLGFIGCLLIDHLSAQAPSRITLRGTIAIDTFGEPAALATVMLLNPADSTLITFTRSDERGVFAFKNLRNTAYFLKISYVGYLPYQQYLPPAESETVDLGRLVLKPIQRELMEVVVRTAKAPLFIRGDTIEYDATMFKVPPGSTVEDLLRRLPGIEVDEAGNIKAQGRDVRRIYVDGKTFFGSDPKLATKNLEAEIVSKVQVFDEKSEIAQLLGIDDGKKERVMNLELKEEFKKGAFGKGTLAGGPNERWAGRTSYNRFDNRHQFSLIGYGNNINETGVNWQDYSEFRGQGTFQAIDNGDFGFGGMPTGIYFSSSEAELLNTFDGRGFTRNAGGGLNYNFDNKKTKANASYTYNQTFLDLDEFTQRDNFLNTGAFNNTDTLKRHSFRGNHRIQTRFEHNFDSLNTLIIRGDFSLNRSDDDEQRHQRFFDGDVPARTINRISADNDADQRSRKLATSAIFRHRFKKPGRAFALSASYSQQFSEQRERFFSQNQLLLPVERLERLQTRNLSDADEWQFKSSALYAEPIGERWFWHTFVNARYSENAANRQVRAPDQNDTRIDSLSVFYTFAEQYYRLGSSVRYVVEGFNITVGLAGQQLTLNGRFARDRNLPLLAPPIRRSFTDLIPYASINLEPIKNLNLDLEYMYRVSAPMFTALQPIPIFTNPAFQSTGNPKLGPERAHNVGLNAFYWDEASFASVGFYFKVDWFDSQVVYNQRVERSDSLGIVTLSRPENVAGGQAMWSYWWSNVSIVKNRLSVSLGGNFGRRLSPAFINDVRNETDDRSWGLDASLNFTPNPKLFLSANGNVNFNNIAYSIQSDLNQRIRNFSAGASAKWEFVSKTFFEGNFNYRFFRNEAFDFRQQVPIVNASIRRLVGPKNRIEVRLAAFDLLNRRIAVNQYGMQNFITTSTAPTLAQYFMLSISYNFRGHVAKAEGDPEGIIIF